jgi:hypothetical protein
MARKLFGGFSDNQKFILLKKLGYTGPQQKDDIAKFMAASPEAASKFKEYYNLAKEMIEGKPVGMATGGSVAPSGPLQKAKDEYGNAVSKLSKINDKLAADPTNEKLIKKQQAYQTDETRTKALLAAAGKTYNIKNTKTPNELINKSLNNPKGLVTKPEVKKMEVSEKHLINKNVGEVNVKPNISPSVMGKASTVNMPNSIKTKTYDPAKVKDKMNNAMSDVEAVEGKVGEKELVDAETMNPDELSQLELEAAQLDTSAQVYSEKDVKKLKDTLAKQQSNLEVTKVSIADAQSELEGIDAQLAINPANTGLKDRKAALVAELKSLESTKQKQKANLESTKTSLDNAEGTTVADRELEDGELVEAATLKNSGIKTPEAKAAELDGKVPTATVAEFKGKTPKAKAADKYELTPTEVAKVEATKIEDAATIAEEEIPQGEAAVSEYESLVKSAQGTVGANELISQLNNAEEVNKAVSTVAATMETVNSSAIATAATASFSQAALANAEQGTVNPMSTVQGQLSNMMQQFNDGTPIWAAGAMRAANAAMAARGMG